MVLNSKKTSCPLCKKAAVKAYHPFCSKRCSDLDLGKWLGGHYAIPASEEDDLNDLSEHFNDDEYGA